LDLKSSGVLIPIAQLGRGSSKNSQTRLKKSRNNSLSSYHASNTQKPKVKDKRQIRKMVFNSRLKKAGDDLNFKNLDV
jgi:hypothetical protein